MDVIPDLFPCHLKEHWKFEDFIFLHSHYHKVIQAILLIYPGAVLETSKGRKKYNLKPLSIYLDHLSWGRYRLPLFLWLNLTEWTGFWRWDCRRHLCPSPQAGKLFSHEGGSFCHIAIILTISKMTSGVSFKSVPVKVKEFYKWGVTTISWGQSVSVYS